MRKTIMLLGVDEEVSTSWAAFLGFEGCNTILAESVESALDILIHTRDLDAALVDYNLYTGGNFTATSHDFVVNAKKYGLLVVGAANSEADRKQMLCWGCEEVSDKKYACRTLIDLLELIPAF